MENTNAFLEVSQQKYDINNRTIEKDYCRELIVCGVIKWLHI